MIGNFIPYGIMAATGASAAWRDAPYPWLLFLIVMASWYTIRMVLTLGEDKAVKEERGARRERVLTSLVALGMIVVPLIALATPFLDSAMYKLVPGQRWLGILSALAGAYFFWRSHADLGKNWSAHLELREDHGLQTEGIYAHIRHPMYLAIFLITLSQALILNNWFAGPAGFVAFIVLYVLRIEHEESMMRDQFGEAWDAYTAKTPRLFPVLRRAPD
ncbi:MAG: protein-S-isoprenylcysteine O-methyltransferase [Pseudomonadota bacterium]